jgi:hypothetical protein
MSDMTPADVAAQSAAKHAEGTESGADGAKEYEQYPPDHPLVVTLEGKKAQNAKLQARLREAEAKAAAFDKLEEANKSQAQKDAEMLAAETRRADEAETALRRYQVAADKGIPGNALKFLTGTTIEEIEASAKDVLELIGDAGKPRPPKPDPNQGRMGAEAATPSSQFAAFLKKQLNNT